MDTHIPFSHPLVYYESIRTGLQPGFFSLFVSHVRETRELSLLNLKKSKNYYPRESFIDKRIQFNRSFVL